MYALFFCSTYVVFVSRYSFAVLFCSGPLLYLCMHSRPQCMSAWISSNDDECVLEKYNIVTLGSGCLYSVSSTLCAFSRQPVCTHKTPSKLFSISGLLSDKVHEYKRGMAVARHRLVK